MTLHHFHCTMRKANEINLCALFRLKNNPFSSPEPPVSYLQEAAFARVMKNLESGGKSLIFQAWKVLKYSSVGYGKSWKSNKLLENELSKKPSKWKKQQKKAENWLMPAGGSRGRVHGLRSPPPPPPPPLR